MSAKRFYITINGITYNLNSKNITPRLLKRMGLLKLQIKSHDKMISKLNRQLYYMVYEIQARSNPAYVKERIHRSRLWYKHNKIRAKNNASRWQKEHPLQVNMIQKRSYNKNKHKILEKQKIKRKLKFPMPTPFYTSQLSRVHNSNATTSHCVTRDNIMVNHK